MNDWQTLLVHRGKSIVCIFLLLITLGCFKQNALIAQFSVLPQEYYSVDDGLSDRNIVDIVQTEDGIVWLATIHGLNRFDGYETLVFNHFPNSPYEIKESNLRKLYLDKRGQLVIIYETTNAKFEIMNPQTFESQLVELLPKNGIRGIPRMTKVDQNGDILILASSPDETNIYKYQSPTQFEKLLSISEKREVQTPSINFIHLQNGEFLITDSQFGLRHFSKDGQLIYSFSSADFSGEYSSEAYPGIATSLHQSKNGQVWYSLQKMRGIYNIQLREHATPQIQHDGPSEYYCIDLWEDQTGNVLIAWSDDPAREYPLNQLSCINSDSQVYNFDYLLNATSKFIVCAYSKNFFSTIFFGIDTGLKIVQNRRLHIDYFLARDVESDDRGAVMRGITSLDNKLYFAREFNHWYELDLNDNLFDTLQMIDSRTGEPLSINCSRSIHQDKNGNLWGVSCENSRADGVLFRYNLSTCIAQTYPYEYPFSAVGMDREGNIWLCAESPIEKGMLLRFNPQSETFDKFKDSEGYNPLKNAAGRYILESKDGMLWVGTDDGLYLIDWEKRQTETFKATGNIDGLASNTVYVLHEDESGHIWIGTTNGFNILNPETKTLEYYSQKDGLASNIVCGFVPDSTGNYWVSTYNGLSYFDREKKSFRNFFSKDGLTHDEFNRFSFYKGPDGRIYLGGVNGINIFRSEDLLFEQQSPKPIISKTTRYNVKKDSTYARYAGITQLDELVLLPGDNYFSIHLTMPNFTSPRRNLYKAWLEGYDKNWTLHTRDPVLTYNKLPPGEYTLHIKGSNAYSDWSEEELILPIKVKPAFYETIWFYLFCLMLAAGILYLIFHYRLEQRLKMERIRTRLSSDLHDEVSGLLSGIAMQTDVLQLSIDDPTSKDKLHQIGEVSRKALSKMSDVIWSIDSRKDRVEELVKRMQEHSDEMLTPLDIAYKMNIDRLDMQQRLPVTLRQNLYFIYKEAINNVAKHSGASKVVVHLKNEGNNFIMHIRDNGQGGKRNGSSVFHKKSGQGLSNLKMRAYRIDAELDINNSENGFEVILKRKKFA